MFQVERKGRAKALNMKWWIRTERSQWGSRRMSKGVNRGTLGSVKPTGPVSYSRAPGFVLRTQRRTGGFLSRVVT